MGENEEKKKGQNEDKVSWTKYRRNELIAFLLIALGTILFLWGTSTRNNFLLFFGVILWVYGGWQRLQNVKSR